MASNGWHRRFACSTGLLLLAIGSVAAQDADFSGRWVLVSPAAAAPDTPDVMSVRQTITRTNIRGEPVKPFVSALTIERELPGGTQAETYKGGIIGGTMPGVGHDRDAPYTGLQL